MNKISAQIIADSLSPQGERLTTYILTYPRFIHAEVMTHRLFSRNTASSRAIPFNKMLKMVQEDPFIPIAWQKDHSGMQGVEYFTDERLIEDLVQEWLYARNVAVFHASMLSGKKATKQLCNRLLEPFLWHTALVTASEWDNFFELRCPKYHSPVDKDFLHKSKKDLIAAHSNPENLAMLDKFTIIDWLDIDESGAEIHIQALAEAMWDAYNESTPKQLQAGEWHIPFGDKMDEGKLYDYIYNTGILQYDRTKEFDEINKLKLKVAVARCARLSYMTFDNEINYQKDIELHDMLLKSKHASPFEHVAKAMDDLQYYAFIKGEVSTSEDDYGIYNYEFYPVINENGVDRPNSTNGNRYGWCNNIKGFIQYRYLIDNEK